MSGISSSSGSVSELFLDDSGSWSLSVMMDDDNESNLNVLYSILGATGFFICLYSVRCWCDKKKGNL